MKRSGFKRKPCAVTGPARCIVPLTRPPNYSRSSDSAIQAPKGEYIRSESYRRAVAALPCIHCGIEGFSQAAHPSNQSRGMKASDDLCFPLCATRPGEPGCHWRHDNGQLFPRSERAEIDKAWALQTQTIIKGST